ncbi:beta strand repeat-containing protein [Yoonia sp. MH D7]
MTGKGGSNGRAGALFVSAHAGGGGQTKPTAPNVAVVQGNYNTTNIGVEVANIGGNGGNGGNGYVGAGGANGGNGGAGGVVDLSFSGNVTTTGDAKHGIYALSRSGSGGNAGTGYLSFGAGSGNGGPGSDGGAVTVFTSGTTSIATNGIGAHGIYGLSVGANGGTGGSSFGIVGNGGTGGSSFGIVGNGGSGGVGGKGGVVSVTNNGDIVTNGVGSHGILAQSIGGGGGDAGTAGGIVAFADVGNAGGSGRNASGSNSGAIRTNANFSRGIFVQSIGGGGGSGGFGGGIFALGGTGAGGGEAGTATATNSGTINTFGVGSDGIMVQSIAGSGGAGGGSGGLVAIGGSGDAGGDGDTVSATNSGTITTRNFGARGIVAQSIGGGGGNGGSTGGMVSVGGSGSVGGAGGNVTVRNDGQITTRQADSTALMAQSIGGGGGNGGSATSVGIFAAVGIGGDGGAGGAGGVVDLTLSDTDVGTQSRIFTEGDRSFGVLAQSIGGGGGNGGGATSVALGFGGALAVSIGGNAGVAGDGGVVTLNGSGSADVETRGADSTGVLLQSVGGGGGNGGFAISVAAAAGPVAGGISVGLGGDGGAGGAGGTVTNSGYDGKIITRGTRSNGMVMQSIGGGGGNGGLSVTAAAALSIGASGSVTVGVGGEGASGGAGGTVNATNTADVETFGTFSDAMVVQSIGGGGGNGGGAISASIGFSGGASAGINVGVGGNGGAASAGGSVTLVTNGDLIRTAERGSQGVVVQSIGGGGGNGGYAIAAGANFAAGAAATVTVGLGGKAGGGGVGGTVSAVIGADVLTGTDATSTDSGGVVIQSIGGGGGTGGFSVSAGISGAGGAAGGVNVGLGGSGGSGGSGGLISRAEVNGDVTTLGDRSGGVLVQSIGGGGGNGGFSVSATVAGAGAAAGTIGVGLGGRGGAGGAGGVVNANINGDVSTSGAQSAGVVTQSIGGGGGNGGFNVTANAAGAGTGAAAIGVGLGGQGGGAGNGNTVDAIVTGTVTTRGDAATGILAQSIGGSGGSGGFNVTASLSGAGTGAVAVGVGLGGNGGVAANAAKVTLRSDETVMTQGHSASGVVAQSIGGGGGAGGFNVTANLGAAGTGAGAIGVGLGGNGAGGGQAGDVDATSNGRIFTDGIASSGFVAQSIGGGGGNGGFNVTATLAAGGKGAVGVGVGLGGQGAGGGNGARVDAAVNATVLTLQDQSTAVLAQSVGGGGGNGGFNVTATLAGGGTGAGALGVGLGGSGAGGGDGGIVNLIMTDDIETRGNNSSGAIAQSIGGGGGNGGFNVTATLAGGGKGAISAAVGLGGTGAGGGNADDVTNVAQSNIMTAGDTSTGLLVQSVGGGGGNGGLNVSANITVAGKGGGGAAVGLGGSAGVGGYAGNVRSTLTGDVDTTGTDSSGVIVQSLGGGGGNGGLNISASITASGKFGGSAAVGLGGSGSGGVNVSAAVNLSADAGGAIAVGLGGAGGSGGDGETATSIVVGDITTLGNNAAGLTVQSLGGGGGNGGLNIAGAVNITGKTGGAISVGVGGFGGGGGMADEVNSDFTGNAQTTGNNAAALIAQSLGGGGGNGATNVSGAISVAKDKGGAIGVGVGGFGGGGGQAGSVRQAATGQFLTRGNDSTGIFTQSLGGGGGSGGTNISAALNISRDTGGAIGIGVGGFGGGGQNAGDLTQSNVIGGVTTLGARSTAILTQSIGGGGGAGGTNVSAAVNLTQNNGGAIGLGLGGFGGSGGNGKVVVSTLRSSMLASGEQSVIDTVGADSIGVLAQSVGGGGGAGGLNVSASVSLSGKSGAAISLGLGGFGGGGGDAGDVTLDAISTITTRGNGADGIFAQSLGGGGGVGGTNISGSLALTKPSGSDTILSISAGVGGFGGGGGDAGDVSVSYDGLLTAVPLTELPDGSFVPDLTSGANGLVAQSIGGGGGNGGTNVSAGLAISSKPGAGQTDRSKSYGLLVGVGGFGGTGGNAGNVAVNVAAGSEIVAHGTGKSGLLAQSVGGGGGNGGLNVSAGIVSDTSLIVGVGGFGGNAGTGGDVNVVSVADIIVTTNPTDLAEPSDEDFISGLTDIVGADVVETIVSQIESKGLRRLFIDVGLFKEDSNETEGSAGLLAQSIGGGGGNGGLNVSGGIALSKDEKIPSVTFGVGGFGGAGNVSGDVSADHTGTITVEGNWKHGIFAQSIAGGGGNGGMNVTGQVNYAKSEQDRGATDFSVVGGLGGHGGAGADAGNVLVVADGNISTTGYHARGIFAQSIGGGGGTGGMNISAVATQNSQPIAMGIGGFGSGGGHAGTVTVQRGSTLSADAMIVTNGTGGHGIEASSIGGGGGDAGINAVLGFSKTTGQESDSGNAGDPDRKVPAHTGVDASVIPNYNAVLDELEGKSSAPEAVPASTQKTTYSGVIAVGGSAGSAGNAGDVDVDHFGLILTQGGASHGIMGQSIGGGGGNAALNVGQMFNKGAASKVRGFAVGIGGGTGDGGNGAGVDVRNTGVVTTLGDVSYGIFAQSIGGGGGNVGYDSVSNKAENGNISVNIGRTGGSGGTGGNVFASSDGTVTTLGDGSHGIFAQSIGNGGGNSSSTSISLSTPGEGDEPGNSYQMSMGLEGGVGGKAGTVGVDASGQVTTDGTAAHGIFAQSVGGGGGTGGGVSSSTGEGMAVAISLGGSGGTGGTGDAVTVTSDALIQTLGDGAIGIMAQSIGGSGGTGGLVKGGPTAFSAVTGLKSTKDIGESYNLSLGGDGGVGMASGTVSVTTTGTILTDGVASHGVFAQSVGGGGGMGGLVTTGVMNLRAEIASQNTLSIGGDGGTGAVSGAVTVANDNSITILDERAVGIFAQSIGGGGGDAQNVSNIILGKAAAEAANNSILIGGKGGEGAKGADVAVTNGVNGAIATLGIDGYGILAQSIGGGGGTGGSTKNVVADTGKSGGSSTEGFNIGLGGSGGEGGSGGAVTVANAGTVTTFGDNAHGIIAQSVGGGGGIGGSVTRGDLALAQGSTSAPSLAISLGGSAGNGGVGGAVTVENSGTISVNGDSAYGIFAQSIGVGGGNGGMVVDLSSSAATAPSGAQTLTQMALGGSAGNGNDSGDVLVNHTGTIVVNSANGYGIFAQSVSGGGGNAGLTLTSSAATIADLVFSTALGARDGANGNVGTVTVNSTGDIILNGVNSQAILSQSIAGGGGSTATAIALISAGNILVSGDGSVGVLAQSLGGGGGAVDAMFFGSAGGAGASGSINLAVQGNILATGVGGIAVLAQSEGKDGAGDIEIVLDGVIMGGSGPSDDSAAIMIDGGNANNVNLSTDSFLMAANNQILRTGAGDETVNLQGQALGNVDLGAGQNKLTIDPGATFYAQDTVDLGASGEMNVDGFLVLGGEVSMTVNPATDAIPSLTYDVSAGAFGVAPLVYQTTKVNGNLTLGATADYIVDASFRQDGQAGVGSDLIDVTGDAIVNGTIRPVLHKLERALPLVIVDVDGLGFDAGAYVIDTALIDYSIGLNGSSGDGSSIDLVADVNFSTANMNLNQTNVGLYINDVLNGEGSAKLGDLFAVMANFETEEEVIQLMSQLTTGDYASNQISAQRGALGFAQALQTCDRPTTALSTLEDTRCHWLQVSGTKYTRDATDNALNFSSFDDGLNGGFRFPLDGQTFVTFGGSHETITVNNGTTFSANGSRNQFGVALQTSRGPWEFSGSLSTGRSTYNANRLINIEGALPDGTQLDATSIATTTQIVSHTNLRFGAGYRHVFAGEQFYIRPGIDVDATRLRSWSAQEIGNRFGVSLQDTTQWATTVTASLEMGADTDLGQGVKMRGFLRGEAIFGDTDNLYVDARLPGTSANDGSFRNYADVDSRSTRLTVGATFTNTRNNTFADVTYERQKGDRSRSSTLGVKLGINF